MREREYERERVSEFSLNGPTAVRSVELKLPSQWTRVITRTMGAYGSAMKTSHLRVPIMHCYKHCVHVCMCKQMCVQSAKPEHAHITHMPTMH